MAEFDSFPAEIHPANYEMKRKHKPEVPNNTLAEPLSIPSLEDCAKLSHADLLKLVERMACQCGLVAAMTDEQRKALAKDRLTRIVQLGDDRDAITAADKVLDRIEGKAAQKLEITLDMVQQFLKEIEGESVLMIE